MEDRKSETLRKERKLMLGEGRSNCCLGLFFNMLAHILPLYFKGRVENDLMGRKIDQFFFMIDILQNRSRVSLKT